MERPYEMIQNINSTENYRKAVMNSKTGNSHRNSATGRELFRKYSILSKLLPCPSSLYVFTFVSKVNLTDAKLLDVARLASQKFIRAVEYYLNYFY